jgi:hypothetical protein
LLSTAAPAEGSGPPLERDALGRTRWTDPLAAAALLYGDCDDATVAWAFARLRPQADAPLREPSPLSRWPATRGVAIACEDDRAVPASAVRRDARRRLGSEPIELPGAHSPFLSRPEMLARELVALASG